MNAPGALGYRAVGHSIVERSFSFGSFNGWRVAPLNLNLILILNL